MKRLFHDSKFFIFFLFAAIVVSFPGVVFGLRAFAYGDAGRFAYPVAFYHKLRFWQGEVPLWNPLSSCGIPFLAQWNTMTLYPLSVIYLLLPLPWSFGIFVLAHLFIAGLGMFLLALRWTNHRAAAAVAGFAFAYNGLTNYGVMWPHLLSGLAWMPWVVLAVEIATIHGGRYIILAALTAGMQLLGGGAEVILQTWIAVAFFRTASFFGTGRKFAWRAPIVLLTALGIAAIQLLPFLQLLANSQRTEDYASSAIGRIAAMPASGLCNYLLPLFHCEPRASGVWMPRNESWTASYYLGIAVIWLALFAVWRARNSKVWLLAALAVFGSIMAFGFSPLAKVLPFLGFMRFPVKFVILPTFALPLLAAFGLARVLTASGDEWPRARRFLISLVLCLAVGIACIAALEKGVHSGNADVRFLMLIAAGSCVLLLRRPAKMMFALPFLLGSMWLDIFTHFPTLHPTVPAVVWEPDTSRQVFGESPPRPRFARALPDRQTFWKLLSTELADSTVDLQVRRQALYMNLNLIDQVPKFDGFYSLDVKNYFDVFKYTFLSTHYTGGLFDFLAVAAAGDSNTVMGWTERPTAQPLISAGENPVFSDGTSVLNAIVKPSFNARETVFLPIAAREFVTTNKTTTASVSNLRVAPQCIECDVQANSPTMVVVAQTWYPNWHAYVDGKRTPLWKANYAFQALQVDKGLHHVSIRYEDFLFHLGALISAISLSVCIAAWWLFSRLKRLAD